MTAHAHRSTTPSAPSVGRPALASTALASTALAFTALVLGELALVSFVSVPFDDRWVLGAAAALDIALFGGLAVWWLARGAGGLAALSIGWARIGRSVLIGLALTGLALRVAEVPIGGWLLAPLVAVELAIGLMVTRALVAGWRSAADARWWARLEASLAARLSPTLARLAVSEVRLVWAALRALTRRPVPPAEGFTATRSSSWRVVAGALLLVALGEAVAVHALIEVFWPDASAAVHGILGAVHGYGILWLLGDARLMTESSHRITDGGLHLDLGLRWSGLLPRARITEVIAGEVAEPDRLLGEKRPVGTVAVTPLETPNVTLRLDAPVTLRGLFGVEREAREVLVYVDDPAGFVAAVTQSTAGTPAMSGSARSSASSASSS